MSQFDVIVIGAGAAGLAAAIKLSRAGLRVCILEARDRVGGRIYTQHEPNIPFPIDLGAEFIHGKSPATLEWLQQTRTAMVDVVESRWSKGRSELQQGDSIFEEMKRGLDRAGHPKHDLAFADYLNGIAKRHLSKKARDFAKALVEGFDAADATRVSTLQTLKTWSESGAADAPTFRPIGGYGAMTNGMAALLDPRTVELRLNTVVREVKWQRGRVDVEASQHGRSISICASRTVITLPLGVLQSQSQSQERDAVQFNPDIKTKGSALNALGFGPVIKLGLWFHEPFWERVEKNRYDGAGFFHAPNAAFPTFWTQRPLHAPLLTAWAGGPNAARWSNREPNEIIEAVLGSLESLFGKRAGVREQLRTCFMHDWQSDPFARGAYSYALVGGPNARRELARPIQSTLYFAGEAADVEGESGTVAGALQSGMRAARLIISNKFSAKKTSQR